MVRLTLGDQQQVLVVRAGVKGGAQILLFEEPTSSFVLRHQMQIIRLIRAESRAKVH